MINLQPCTNKAKCLLKPANTRTFWVSESNREDGESRVRGEILSAILTLASVELHLTAANANTAHCCQARFQQNGVCSGESTAGVEARIEQHNSSLRID